MCVQVIWVHALHGMHSCPTGAASAGPGWLNQELQTMGEGVPNCQTALQSLQQCALQLLLLIQLLIFQPHALQPVCHGLPSVKSGLLPIVG